MSHNTKRKGWSPILVSLKSTREAPVKVPLFFESSLILFFTFGPKSLEYKSTSYPFFSRNQKRLIRLNS